MIDHVTEVLIHFPCEVGSTVRRYISWYFLLVKEEVVKSSSGVNCMVSCTRYGCEMAAKAVKDGEDMSSLRDGH